MSAVADPATGLEFHEIGHRWVHGMPSMPGDAGVSLYLSVKHAHHGVTAHRIRMVMYTGTHLNAPIHLIQKGAGGGVLPLDAIFGNGGILIITKGKWEIVEGADLEAAAPGIQQRDRVVIFIGWHFLRQPGVFRRKPGAFKRRRRVVGGAQGQARDDGDAADRQPAGHLARRASGGPLMTRLAGNYRRETGCAPKKDFPEWNVAHHTLLGAGIPTVENLGGNVDDLPGRRAMLHAAPGRWLEGAACMIRFVAISDPKGKARIEPGAAA